MNTIVFFSVVCNQTLNPILADQQLLSEQNIFQKQQFKLE